MKSLVVKSLAVKLKKEGFSTAANALNFQATVRALPHHSHDTLLVYGTGSRGTLASCTEKMETETPSSSGSSLERTDEPDQNLAPLPCLGQEVGGAGLFGSSSERTNEPGDRPTLVLTAHTLQATSKNTAKLPHPTNVTTMRTEAYRAEVQQCLYGRYRKPLPPLKNPQSADTKARKALAVQRPKEPTVFTIKETSSSELLPGGAPIVDQVIAFLETQPAWQKTSEVLKLHASARITLPNNLPEIRELVIGEASHDQFQEMGKWIDAKHKETIDDYGFCLPALDVEELSLMMDDIPSNWTEIKTEIKTSGKLRAKLDAPSHKKTKRFNFPVLLMYGSVGWQVHLRIHLVYTQSGDELRVEIPAGDTRAETFTEFFKHLRPAVGTGIQGDISSFLQAVNAIHGTALDKNDLPVGIPLEQIAKLSGISHTQTSIPVLTFLTLGGILPKDWRCSVADHQWGKPLADLGIGLQAYLAGDIQQVSRVAAVLIIAWIVHLVPSGEYVRSEMQSDPLQFIADCVDYVTMYDLTWTTPRGQTVQAETRHDLLRGMGLCPNDGSSLVSFCPPWPAITSGGPKLLNSTLEFSKLVIRMVGEWSVLDRIDEITDFVSAIPKLPKEASPLLSTPKSTPVKSNSLPADLEFFPLSPSPRIDTEPLGISVPQEVVKQLPCVFCSHVFGSRADLIAHILSCGEESLVEPTTKSAEAEVEEMPARSLPNPIKRVLFADALERPPSKVLRPPIAPTPMDTDSLPSDAHPQAPGWLPPAALETESRGEPKPRFVGRIRLNPILENVDDPFFCLAPFKLKARMISDTATKYQVTQKELVAEYIIRDLDRAVALLAFLEDHKKLGKQAIKLFAGRIIVESLRIHLLQQGRLRDRPVDWVDKWNIQTLTQEEEEERAKLLKVQVDKAARRLEVFQMQMENPVTLKSLPEPAYGEGISSRARRRRNKKLRQAGLLAPVQQEEEVRRVIYKTLSPLKMETSPLYQDMEGSPPRTVMESSVLESISSDEVPLHSQEIRESPIRDLPTDDTPRDRSPPRCRSRARSRSHHQQRLHRSRSRSRRKQSRHRPRSYSRHEQSREKRTVGSRSDSNYSKDYRRQSSRSSHRDSRSRNQSRSRHPERARGIPTKARGRVGNRRYEDERPEKHHAPRDRTPELPQPPAARNHSPQPPKSVEETVSSLPDSPELMVYEEDGQVVLVIDEDPPVASDPDPPAESIPPPVQTCENSVPVPSQSDWPEITQEMLDQISKCQNGRLTELQVVQNLFIGVTRRELKSLNTGKELYDSVINCYLQMIVERSLSSAAELPRVGLITSYHFPKMRHGNFDNRDLSKCDVDFFKCSFIFVPLNLGLPGLAHWTLAMINNETKTVYYYDSLAVITYPYKESLKVVHEYIRKEHEKRRLPKPFYKTDVRRDIPFQVGSKDCGIFVCMYAEYLSRRQPFNFSQEDVAYWRMRIGWELLQQKMVA